MTSGVPWQLKGVPREAIETAREAARRSGVSVGEWLDTVIAESARGAGIEPARQARSDLGNDQSPGASEDVRQWRRRHSDDEDRQRWGQEPELSDVNARLDVLSRQLDQLTTPPAADVRQPRAPGPDDVVDEALAEIEARQRSLDGEATAPRMEFARAPTQSLPDLEQQLRQINARMESVRPCSLDNAVETLRDDLAEIGVMLKDAMPRRAIEALESEVRSLTSRIDDKRHDGAESAAIEGVERGLAEVRDALRAITPSENLAGFDETVQGLAQKIDRLAGMGTDPAALKQLEGAVLGLRGVVSQVASDDALTRLSEEVRGLSAKVDQATASDALSTIEQRVAAITDSLQLHDPAGQHAANLEAVVSSLSDKIERLHSSRSEGPAVAHLEDRIVQLVEKLDASDARLHQLEAVERGLADLLHHIEHQQAAGRGLESDSNALKRDVQRTQDSLESVHGTLGQVVDRLANIETTIRDSHLPRAANIPETVPAPARTEPHAAPVLAPPPVLLQPATPPAAPPAREVPPAVAPVPTANPSPAASANPSPPAERRPIDPNLPPDHPLEPGAVRGRSGATPADRIAASEAALENVRPPVIPDPGGKSNFIAAARRAAQAAMVEAPPPKEKRSPASSVASLGSSVAASIAGKFGGKIRKMMVGAGLILFILGALHFVATRIWFSGASAPETAAQVPQDAAPATSTTGGEAPASRTAPDRQSSLLPPGFGFPPRAPTSAIGAPTGGAPGVDRDATGSIRTPGPQAAPAAPTPMPLPAPARDNGADRLPAGIGSGGLRAAAARGDPSAEFEIATRFADGRGVPQNLPEAAVWFERAASRGLAPAQFRLGGLYEKGMGVRKNTDTARRLYLAAAEAGNAKAMHNLAVLFAEGVEGKPDYQMASRWFRKAADHGVADSQYNLAILYARGIGVETNLAEAFKWFSLASRAGDREAARKRDDVAGRLDKPSLAAAAAAAAAWQPQQQSDAAVQVAVPTGGWDGVPTPSTPKRSVGPKVDTQRRPAQ